MRDIKLATFIAFMSSILLTIGADMVLGTDFAPLPDQVMSLPPSLAPSFGQIFNFSLFTPEKLFDLLFIVLIFFIVSG